MHARDTVERCGDQRSRRRAGHLDCVSFVQGASRHDEGLSINESRRCAACQVCRRKAAYRLLARWTVDFYFAAYWHNHSV